MAVGFPGPRHEHLGTAYLPCQPQPRFQHIRTRTRTTRLNGNGERERERGRAVQFTVTRVLCPVFAGEMARDADIAMSITSDRG